MSVASTWTEDKIKHVSYAVTRKGQSLEAVARGRKCTIEDVQWRVDEMERRRAKHAEVMQMGLRYGKLRDQARVDAYRTFGPISKQLDRWEALPLRFEDEPRSLKPAPGRVERKPEFSFGVVSYG